MATGKKGRGGRVKREAQPADEQQQEAEAAPEYRRGSIVRVCLERFVTYDSVEFRPGPNLNVIIGPNGNGKSTLVCAMCLGLGGSPRLLGRATKASEYIKHGEDSCRIELELYKEEGNVIVERIINANNSSTWRIDGQTAREKDIQGLVQHFSIQFDNLCQFLPQDKVAEFAKANEQVRLAQTQQAIGPPEMLEAHKQLIELQRGQDSSGTLLDDKKKQYEKLQAINQGLETDVRSWHDMQSIREQHKIARQKWAWTRYNKAKEEHDALRHEKLTMHAELQAAQEENLPLHEKVKTLEREATNLQQRLKAAKDGSQQAYNNTVIVKEEELTRLTDKCDTEKVTLASAVREEKNVQARIKDQETRLVECEKKVHELEQAATGAEDAEGVEVMIQQLQEKERTAKGKQREVAKHVEAKAREKQAADGEVAEIQRQLRDLENQLNQRLQNFRKAQPDVYNAVQWLRSNKQRFEQEVYEPVSLVVSIDAAYAKYMEMSTPPRIMSAFTVQNKRDQDTILRELVDTQGFKINVILAPPESDGFTPPRSIEELRQFGFENYLSDLYTAPDAVKRMLCRDCQHHSTPVGTQQTSKYLADRGEQAVELLFGMNIRRFYTPDTCYNIKRSNYGNHNMISRTDAIRPAQTFTNTVDTEAQQRLEERLQEQRRRVIEIEEAKRELEERQREYMGQTNTIATRLAQLKSHQKDLAQARTQLQTRRDQLADQQRRLVEARDKQVRIKTSLQRLLTARCRVAIDLAAVIKESVDRVHKTNILEVEFLQAKSVAAAAKKSAEAASEHLKTLQKDYDKISRELAEVNKVARKYMEEAKVFGEPNEQTLHAYSEFPNTVEELEQQVSDLEARIALMRNVDEDIIRQYEEREQEIQALKGEYEELKEAHENEDQRIAQLKQQWLVPLNELVQGISDRFGKFMADLGCCGEVKLVENDKFSEYGIQILVQFRKNDKLSALTDKRQSGGERSVSTIMYLMALQASSTCPFRVVDEINQGMDPRNERAVFDTVVECASYPKSSQYFLITPKLLPDLRYGERMTILTVFNGPGVLPHSQWNVSDFLARRRALGRA